MPPSPRYWRAGLLLSSRARKPSASFLLLLSSTNFVPDCPLNELSRLHSSRRTPSLGRASLLLPRLNLSPEPLHHSRPVLVRYISIPGNPERRLEAFIHRPVWFPTQLMHVLDILLYCALVVWGQCWRP